LLLPQKIFLNEITIFIMIILMIILLKFVWGDFWNVIWTKLRIMNIIMLFLIINNKNIKF